MAIVGTFGAIVIYSEIGLLYSSLQKKEVKTTCNIKYSINNTKATDGIIINTKKTTPYES